MPMTPSGHLLELFSAPQGEGVLAGTPMLFVRFSGCAIGCRFCDTRRSWKRSPEGHLRWGGEGVEAGAEPFQNPVHVAVVQGWAERFRARQPGLAWISLTGGEPLEQPAFAASLAKALKGDGWKLYLETAGLHPAAMRKLSPTVDFVSMDWKLESSARIKPNPRSHKAFLKAVGSLPGQVKAVVVASTPAREVEAAAEAVSGVQPSWSFVVQPRTEAPPPPEALARLASAAARRLASVRILRQGHRLTAGGPAL